MGQAFMTRRGGGGKKLPELDLPAIASHIVEGYEAINGEGEKMVGTLGSNITKPATAAQITSGYQAINGLGELINGTAMQYYCQTYTLKATSTSKNSYFDFKPTGSVIDLAVVWAEQVFDGELFGGYAVIRNNEVVYDEFGEYTSSNVSISGTTITPVLNYRDISTNNDGDPLNLQLLAFSHNP